MRVQHGWFALVVAACVAAGCAAEGPVGRGVAAPTATAVPPVIVGAGMPTASGEAWLGGAAVAASAVSAPLHAVGCAGSALVWGFFYGLYFPGDFADDFKRQIAADCAGPYLVTPAELAAVPQAFPVRTLRTPRTGTVPVEEAVRQPPLPR